MKFTKVKRNSVLKAVVELAQAESAVRNARFELLGQIDADDEYDIKLVEKSISELMSELAKAHGDEGNDK